MVTNGESLLLLLRGAATVVEFDVVALSYCPSHLLHSVETVQVKSLTESLSACTVKQIKCLTILGHPYLAQHRKVHQRLFIPTLLISLRVRRLKDNISLFSSDNGVYCSKHF